jgi:hexosaminidase
LKKFNRYKTLFIVSACLNVLGLTGFVGKRIYYSNSGAVAQADYAQQHNDEKCELYRNLPIDKTDIVLVGNSIAENFPASEMLNTLKVKNRGIGSNQTAHVLGRIEAIAIKRPSMIILEIGINDLARGVAIGTIMRNYNKIVDLIHQASPGTKLLIQSILPTTGAESYLNPAIITLNSLLMELCKQKHAAYIDMYKRFVLKNEMSPGLTTDGVHLNYNGYHLYSLIIGEYINPTSGA